jgi:solute carrier family 25 carnitine/acylcarnitine transporter 20/29
MQSDNIAIDARRYTSYFDCVRKTYADGGVIAFFKGYVPSLARAIPVNAAIFCAVFQVKERMKAIL